MKISLGNLKEKGQELATFLEPRIGTTPSLSGDSIEIEDGSLRKGVRPRQVKTYIKRFMYMNGVRKNYRVFVAGKELTIQEIELGEKEEEEKEKKAKAEAPAPEEEKEETEKAEKEEAGEPKPEKPKKTAVKKPRTKKKKETSED